MGPIYMDLGTAIVLDSEEDDQKYIVSCATKEYCSPEFYHACGFDQ